MLPCYRLCCSNPTVQDRYFEFQSAVLNPPGRLQGMEFSLTPLFNLAQPSLLLCEYMYETSIYKVKECDRLFDNYLDKS